MTSIIDTDSLFNQVPASLDSRESRDMPIDYFEYCNSRDLDCYQKSLNCVNSQNELKIQSVEKSSKSICSLPPEVITNIIKFLILPRPTVPIERSSSLSDSELMPESKSPKPHNGFSDIANLSFTCKYLHSIACDFMWSSINVGRIEYKQDSKHYRELFEPHGHLIERITFVKNISKSVLENVRVLGLIAGVPITIWDPKPFPKNIVPPSGIDNWDPLKPLPFKSGYANVNDEWTTILHPQITPRLQEVSLYFYNPQKYFYYILRYLAENRAEKRQSVSKKAAKYLSSTENESGRKSIPYVSILMDCDFRTELCHETFRDLVKSITYILSEFGYHLKLAFSDDIYMDQEHFGTYKTKVLGTFNNLETLTVLDINVKPNIVLKDIPKSLKHLAVSDDIKFEIEADSFQHLESFIGNVQSYHSLSQSTEDSNGITNSLKQLNCQFLTEIHITEINVINDRFREYTLFMPISMPKLRTVSLAAKRSFRQSDYLVLNSLDAFREPLNNFEQTIGPFFNLNGKTIQRLYITGFPACFASKILDKTPNLVEYQVSSYETDSYNDSRFAGRGIWLESVNTQASRLGNNTGLGNDDSENRQFYKKAPKPMDLLQNILNKPIFKENTIESFTLPFNNGSLDFQKLASLIRQIGSNLKTIAFIHNELGRSDCIDIFDEPDRVKIKFIEKVFNGEPLFTPCTKPTLVPTKFTSGTIEQVKSLQPDKIKRNEGLVETYKAIECNLGLFDRAYDNEHALLDLDNDLAMRFQLVEDIRELY